MLIVSTIGHMFGILSLNALKFVDKLDVSVIIINGYCFFLVYFYYILYCESFVYYNVIAIFSIITIYICF